MMSQERAVAFLILVFNFGGVWMRGEGGLGSGVKPGGGVPAAPGGARRTRPRRHLSGCSEPADFNVQVNGKGKFPIAVESVM